MKTNMKSIIARGGVFVLLLMLAFNTVYSQTKDFEDYTLDGVKYAKCGDKANKQIKVYELVGTVADDLTIATTIEQAGYTWTVVEINAGAFNKTAYNSNIKTITLPTTIKEIGASAFENCTNLTEVKNFPSLTSLPNALFKNCTALTSFTIPSTVTAIGKQCFYGCTALTSLDIPSSVTSIGEYAFYGCSAFTTIGTLPNITEIAQYTFHGASSLTSINVPASVTSIGQSAFEKTTALKTVTFEERNGAALTLADNIFRSSGLTTIDLPSGIADLSKNTFYQCTSLKEVTLPATLQTIGQNCFYQCSVLTTVSTFPSTLTTIGLGAFNGCTSLSCEIVIPASVTSIGKDAFTNTTALKTVRFEERDGDDIAYTMGTHVFNHSGITDAIRLPKGLTSIEEQTFNECTNLQGITLPVTLESIGKLAFYNCTSITELVIPAAINNIGDAAFQACKGLTKLTLNIDASTITVGEKVFDQCSALKELSFHGNFSSIPHGMFYNCSGLETVTFPRKVTSIGERAFVLCTNLKKIVFESDEPPAIGSEAFTYYLTNGDNGLKQTSVETIEYSCRHRSAYESDTYKDGKDFINWFRDVEYPMTNNDIWGSNKHLIVNKSVILIDDGEPSYMDGTICSEFATDDTVTIQVGGSFAFDASNSDVLTKVKKANFIIEQELKVDQWNFVGPGIDDTQYGFLNENHGLHGHHDMAAVGYDYEKNDWSEEYAHASDKLPMHKVDGKDYAIGGIMAYVFDHPPVTYPGWHYTLGDETVKLPKHIKAGDLWELYQANGTGTMGTVQFSLENNGPINSEEKSSSVQGMWYALHNLYVGRLDVTKFLAQNEAQGNTLYTYDNDAWVAHENGTTDDNLKEIRPGKGFMIAAKEPSSGTDEEKLTAQRKLDVTFETSMINHITNSKKSDTQNNYIVFSSKANDTERTAKAACDTKAKNGFDGEDAYVMISTNREDFVEPYFVVDNRWIMTNKFNSYPYTVPVNFHASKVSDVDFSIKTKVEGIGVELLDLVSGENFDLTNGEAFHFVADSGENSSRFAIKFYITNVSDEAIAEQNDNIEITSHNRTVYINTPMDATVQIINALGQTTQEENISVGSSQISVQGASGMYVVKVRTNDAEKIKKITVK